MATTIKVTIDDEKKKRGTKKSVKGSSKPKAGKASSAAKKSGTKAKPTKTAKKENAAKKSKYTQEQREAFKTGKAYRLGRDGKKIAFKPDSKLKESFDAGYEAGGKGKYKDLDGKK